MQLSEFSRLGVNFVWPYRKYC
eukprot:SAG11_NODE_4964_length_1708_cov_13.844624_2_plen_21_part_01